MSRSEVRSSFRQHGRYFEKNGLAPAKSEMTLSGTREVREGNFARAACSRNGQTLAQPRHAASGVAGAQGLHGL